MHAFDMRRHREEMMRTFWPVDLRTGIPLTEKQAEQLFSQNGETRRPTLRLDQHRLTKRQDGLLAAVRRGHLNKHENQRS